MFALAACVALAACSKPAPEDEPTSEEAEPSAVSLVEELPAAPIDTTTGTANTANLLANGSFEKGINPNNADGSWKITGSPGADVKPASGVAADGDRALQFTVGELVTRMRAAQWIYGQHHGPMRVRALGLAEGVEGSLGVRVVGMNGQTLADEKVEVNAAQPMKSWAAMQSTFAATAAARGMYVYLDYRASRGLHGKFWFDDVSLQPLPMPASLLANGDFTGGADGLQLWSVTEGLRVRRMPSGLGESIPNAIVITTLNNKHVELTQTARGLDPGGRYRLQAYIRTDSVQGGVTLEAGDTQSEPIGGVTDWRLVQHDFTQPTGSNENLIAIRRIAPAGGSRSAAVIFIANVELIPIGPGNG